ncbi:MAG: hypothetical protein AYK23_04240 [Candidatus Proteinoplasmatales archaeon SG8-5]|nr:MAG: hypothetical protein AYK23_04240 [Candidatus Proteinoplasmatales archaeon SG8-5]
MSEHMVSTFSEVKGEGDKTETRSHRIKARRQWNDEGVASTVGTIMALMVFMAFLSMFTNQYVPVWMEENESSHMIVAYGQFSNLKNAIDLQILAGTIQGVPPTTITTPVTLGSNGIPVFASATAGYLGAYNRRSYNNVSFSFNVGTTILDYRSPQFGSTLGGTIMLECPNRYYVPQTLAYENDAIILQQEDGEYMRSSPQLIVTPSGGNRFDITYTQVDLRGDDTKYVGFGTRGIQTILRSVSSTTFTNMSAQDSGGDPTFLNITHTTRYESAWYNAFDLLLEDAGMQPGVDYSVTSTQVGFDPMDPVYRVNLSINPNSISLFTFTVAHVELVTAEAGAT